MGSFMENRIADSFSDDSIRRFLLGQLQGSEQTTFEEQLFLNSELEARVRLAEFELADDYAFKRLTESETESFRDRYLLTADRNQKLNVSESLRDRFMLASTATKPSMYERLMPFFDLRLPAWRYAFAAFLLVLILATVFLVTKEPQIAGRLFPGPFKPRPQPTTSPDITHHSTAPSSPAHVEQSPPAAPHELPLSVPLTSLNSIDQAPLVTLPSGENTVVRFQLSIKGAQGTYRADLFAASGEALFSADSLKPNGAKPSIDFDVPANTLKSGQYQIRLSRTDDQAKQESSQYYFRVQ